MKLRKEPAFTPLSEDFKSKWDKVLWNAEINLVKLLLSESDVVIDKINKEQYSGTSLRSVSKNIWSKRLEMEKKQLPFMSKLEKRQYKKWNSLNVNVAKRLTPTRDIN